MRGKQVFEGVKVVDLTWIATGPMVTKYLADHGATVIRIESKRRLDGLRQSPPFKDSVFGINRSSSFACLNTSKYSMTLDLKHPRGKEFFKQMVLWADIVAESFTPGTMEQWGLDYAELKKIKPDIIMLSISLQGQTGPHRLYQGFGMQVAGLVGIQSVTGWPDRLPLNPYGAYPDMISPHLAAAYLIAALDYHRQTGEGQYIDFSQLELTIPFLAPAFLDYTVNKRVAKLRGNREDCAAPHNAFRCKGDDNWVAIAVFTDEEWEAFCKVIGEPAWTKEPKFSTLLARKRNEDELDKLVEQWTINYSSFEVMQMLQTAGVPAGVVQKVSELYNDPQLKYRHFFQELNHPEIGKAPYGGFQSILSKTPGELRPAPCLGEHNRYVCTEILGVSNEEFEELSEQGVFE